MKSFLASHKKDLGEGTYTPLGGIFLMPLDGTELSTRKGH